MDDKFKIKGTRDIGIKLTTEDFVNGKSLKFSTIQKILKQKDCFSLINFLITDDITKTDVRLINVRHDFFGAFNQTETISGEDRLLKDISKLIRVLEDYICKEAIEKGYDFLLEDWFIFRYNPEYFERAIILGQKGIYQKIKNGKLVMIFEEPIEKEMEEVVNLATVKIFEISPEFEPYHNIRNVRDGYASYDNPEPIDTQVLKKLTIELK